MRRADLQQRLAAHGLRLRGGWRPEAGEPLPTLPSGAPVAVVWMVGQVGSEVWPHFQQSSFAHDDLPDPMDRWAKSIGHPLAAELGGLAIFPSDGPPWWPFQQWACRSEPVASSPLGLLIHPQWGLWHAYRFALALPRLDVQDSAALEAAATGLAGGSSDAASVALSDLCSLCDDQPCLRACPVDAFGPGGYAVDACASHLHGGTGTECMGGGCLARRACPVGSLLRYQPAHTAFHMRAFAHRH